MNVLLIFFFQAEDGIRDSVASRGLGDVYKRQGYKMEVLAERTELDLNRTSSAELGATLRFWLQSSPISFLKLHELRVVLTQMKS